VERECVRTGWGGRGGQDHPKSRPPNLQSTTKPDAGDPTTLLWLLKAVQVPVGPPASCAAEPGGLPCAYESHLDRIRLPKTPVRPEPEASADRPASLQSARRSAGALPAHLPAASPHRWR